MSGAVFSLRTMLLPDSLRYLIFIIAERIAADRLVAGNGLPFVALFVGSDQHVATEFRYWMPGRSRSHSSMFCRATRICRPPDLNPGQRLDVKQDDIAIVASANLLCDFDAFVRFFSTIHADQDAKLFAAFLTDRRKLALRFRIETAVDVFERFHRARPTIRR